MSTVEDPTQEEPSSCHDAKPPANATGYEAFHTIDFGHNNAVVMVSTLLRAAWVHEPSPEGIDRWVLSYHRKSEDEKSQTAKNADFSTLHTPWRDEIYMNWNHVFHDGFKLVKEAVGGIGPIGGFHPPSHDILPLPYGTVEKVWETGVMLIPAYLAPGVQVKMLSAETDEKGERHEFGKFDGQNTTELWWLMRDHKVLFEVEGGTEIARDGPAAVLAVGIGCTGDWCHFNT